MSAAPGESGLLTHRIVRIPAVPPEPSPSAAMRLRMLPTLAMAHAGGRPVVSCWLRTTPHGRVAVLVGGVGQVSAHGSLPFPAGAQAKPLRREQADDAVGRLACWNPAQVAVDLLTDDDSEPSPGPTLDDLFALLPDRPMAVFAAAAPVCRADVSARLDELSDTVNELEPRRTGRGVERIRLARAEEELRYLERGSAHGLWRLRIWTGAGTDEECAAVAALVGAGHDLVDVPLRVRPGRVSSGDENGVCWSTECVVGADAVAGVLRPPTVELPGILVTEPPRFDLTPEGAAELRIGSVLDATGQPALPFGVSRDSVNRHVLVTGATGAGKSQTVRSLLERLTRENVPWLVIEPAKAEYAAMAGRVRPAEVVVIRPGRVDVVPGSLNPLEPSEITVHGRSVRFPLQTHLDLVRALFTASFEAQEPFPQLLAAALNRCYERQGWNLTLSDALDGHGPPRWPTLSDLQRQALLAVDEIGYAAEVRQNVRGFVRVRIDSLRSGTPGRFFEGGHPLDLEELLRRNVVFEIEDLGDDHDKAFFIGCVLLRLFEVLRLRERCGVGRRGLAHVTVVEEAHRLLRAGADGPAAADAVTMFANLLAEVRAYGEGIVVAEQIPAKLVPDVVKNSAVKLMHRLPARDDRDFVGATMNLADDQSAQVVALRPGVAVAHTDGMDHPVLVAVDRGGLTSEDASAAVTAPPVLRRHAGCPDYCVAAPCTLRDITRADHLPDGAGITLLAEIAVVAHLVGQPLGAVEPDLRKRMRDPLASCAIGTAVHAAVARRHRYIRRWYDPDDLTRRVTGVLRTHARNGRNIDAPAFRWRVAQFRWSEVHWALRAGGSDPEHPHPDTARWAATGLVVSGTTHAEQYRSAVAQAHRDRAPTAAVLGGEPMVIDAVTASLAGGDPPADRITKALELLGLRSDWPAVWLQSCWEDDNGS